MKKENFDPLSPTQAAELKALSERPEETLAHGDMPEQQDWTGAKRGLFYRPIKRQLTLRLDADVIAWFKAHVPKGAGYQTRMNHALREYVTRHEAD